MHGWIEHPHQMPATCQHAAIIVSSTSHYGEETMILWAFTRGHSLSKWRMPPLE
jgi:hypothetical protein